MGLRCLSNGTPDVLLKDYIMLLSPHVVVEVWCDPFVDPCLPAKSGDWKAQPTSLGAGPERKRIRRELLAGNAVGAAAESGRETY
jgi:hypothetical protein